MMCFDPISYDKAEKARKHSENVQEQLNQVKNDFIQHKLDYVEQIELTKRDIIQRASNENRFITKPIVDIFGNKDYAGLLPFDFTRATTSTNPQTGKVLDINEPAIVNCFPSNGVTNYKRVMPTTMIVQAIDSNGTWWGCNEGSHILQKSLDQGATWVATASTGLTSEIGAIHITAQNTIIVTCLNRVYRSIDGGETFDLVLTMQTDARGRWPALTSNGLNVYIGEYGSGVVGKVYKSVNDGVDWQVIDDVTGLVTHIHFVAEDPYNGDIWYGTGDSTAGCMLKRSTDGGATWNIIGQGSQRWRITDVSFFSDAVYFAGDGWLGDGEKFGIFKYDKVANLYSTVRSDFDHVFYHSPKDPMGRVWFIGHSHGLHGDRDTLPSRSVIWVMDRTGHYESRRNKEEFIKVAEFPILAMHTTGSGLAQVLFDKTKNIYVANGWNLACMARTIVDDISSVYHQGIRVDDGELYHTKLPNATKKGTVLLALQFPRDRSEYLTGKPYAGNKYILQIGDNKDQIILLLIDGVLYGRVKVNYAWQPNLAGNSISFNKNDILLIGISFDCDINKIDLIFYLRNYGTRSYSYDRLLPASFTDLYLGGSGSVTDSNNSGGYVLSARFWDEALSTGRLEYELHKMAEEIYPNGMYPPEL